MYIFLHNKAVIKFIHKNYRMRKKLYLDVNIFASQIFLLGPLSMHHGSSKLPGRKSANLQYVLTYGIYISQL